MKTKIFLVGLALLGIMALGACSKPLPTAEEMNEKRTKSDEKLTQESDTE